jgi:hypothetical protein
VKIDAFVPRPTQRNSLPSNAMRIQVPPMKSPASNPGHERSTFVTPTAFSTRGGQCLPRLGPPYSWRGAVRRVGMIRRVRLRVNVSSLRAVSSLLKKGTGTLGALKGVGFFRACPRASPLFQPAVSPTAPGLGPRLAARKPSRLLLGSRWGTLRRSRLRTNLRRRVRRRLAITKLTWAKSCGDGNCRSPAKKSLFEGKIDSAAANPCGMRHAEAREE